MTLSALVNGYIIGWSVASRPGPINAEMDPARFVTEGPRRRILVGLADWSWRLHWRFYLGLLCFRRCRRPAQLYPDPACARDCKSRTALISGGPLRHWSVENLLRSSQHGVSTAKKRTGAAAFCLIFLWC
jgi:hypothetical protein